MLIRYGIENFRSIRERQELSLVASSLRDDQADLFDHPLLRYSILPAAVIYGANASGKTSMLEGLRFIKRVVLNSHKELADSRSLPRIPFALDEDSQAKESTFDIEFINGGVRYAYGFACLDREFTKEWLYAYPKGVQQIWFERISGEEIYFGKALKGQLRAIASLTREDSLFLSVAAQYNNEQLADVFSYFRRAEFVNNTIDRMPRSELVDRHKEAIVRFLSIADTGVVALKFERIEEDDDDRAVRRRIQKAVMSAMPKNAKDVQTTVEIDKADVVLTHQGAGNSSKELPFSEESKGTLRSISLLPSLFDALENGSILVVDELDASLHTVISERMVQLFNDRETNPLGAQLIATTHDTNLLVGDVLRRDQIWFTEKSKDGATHLYPLTDIKTRQADNLERGYLEGRFGAIPMRTSIRRFKRKLGDGPTS